MSGFAFSRSRCADWPAKKVSVEFASPPPVIGGEESGGRILMTSCQLLSD